MSYPQPQNHMISNPNPWNPVVLVAAVCVAVIVLVTMMASFYKTRKCHTDNEPPVAATGPRGHHGHHGAPGPPGKPGTDSTSPLKGYKKAQLISLNDKSAGTLAYNTTDNTVVYYNGSKWLTIAAGTDLAT